ncbi:MAG: MEMO1 family protein [Firmicutes bacterium]|nr:MEMO1 family protein [Candidatus Caballimonas caccae]
MIEEILKYQKKDAELRKIEVELANSEERKKTVSAKKFIESSSENIDKLDLRAAELVSAYEKATNEQLKLKEQQDEIGHALSTVADENAASFLLKKAEELLNMIKNLGQEAKRISNEIQNVIKEYAQLKNNLAVAKTQFNEYGEKYQALKASKKDDMDNINKELAVLRKAVDPVLMEKYDKKRAEKLFPVIFEAKEDVCGACSMNLSMIDIAKLKNGEIIECDNCRRLLYKA